MEELVMFSPAKKYRIALHWFRHAAYSFAKTTRATLKSFLGHLGHLKTLVGHNQAPRGPRFARSSHLAPCCSFRSGNQAVVEFSSWKFVYRQRCIHSCDVLLGGVPIFSPLLKVKVKVVHSIYFGSCSSTGCQPSARATLTIPVWWIGWEASKC